MGLRCEICSKPALGVASSIFGAISHAYCAECLYRGREVWSTLVGGLFGLGRGDLEPWMQVIVDATCLFYGRTEDQLWKEVEQEHDNMDKSIGYQPDIVFYHGHCPDGFTAAWLCWHVWPDTEYVGLTHGNKLDVESCKGKRVLFVDFCPKTELPAIIEICESVKVIDHHKTALPILQELATPLTAPCGKLSYVYDVNESGASLVWSWLLQRGDVEQSSYLWPNISMVDRLVRYVRDMDLWLKKMEYTEEFSIYLSTKEMNWAGWDEIVEEMWQDFSGLIAKGRLLKGYSDRLIDEIIRRNLRMIDGVPTVNSPIFQSEIGNRIYQSHGLPNENPNNRFACVWSIRSDGKATHSLRSSDEGVDVGELAKSVGGGGHRNAAGYELDLWKK